MTTLTAHVKNGQIVLDDPAQLPEGAEVKVAIEPSGDDAAAPSFADRYHHSTDVDEDMPPQKEQPKTFAERYRSIMGKAEGLPRDAALNYRHYLYGTPKFEPLKIRESDGNRLNRQDRQECQGRQEEKKHKF